MTLPQFIPPFLTYPSLCPFKKKVFQKKFVLFEYSWLCGLPLECYQELHLERKLFLPLTAAVGRQWLHGQGWDCVPSFLSMLGLGLPWAWYGYEVLCAAALMCSEDTVSL